MHDFLVRPEEDWLSDPEFADSAEERNKLPDLTWDILLGLGLGCLPTGLKVSTISVEEKESVQQTVGPRFAAVLNEVGFHLSSCI